MQHSVDQAAELTAHQQRIEMKQAEIRRTVAEIEERLNPGNLAGRAGNAVKEATVGKMERAMGDMGDRVADTGGSVVDRIKANPIPAALAASGLAWLFFSGNKGRNGYRSYRAQPSGRYYAGQRRDHRGRYQAGEESGTGFGRATGMVGDTAGQVGGSIGDTAQQVGSAIGDTASQVKSGLSDTASQVGDTASQFVSRTGDQVGELADRAQYQAGRLQQNVQQMLEENPLPLALLAVGLGALIGAAVPKTNVEQRFAAEVQDQIQDQIRQ
jgi:ElaB/YqjD/DUF883 family membrane-anchored ribosome-binding protein